MAADGNGKRKTTGALAAVYAVFCGIQIAVLFCRRA